MIFVCCVVSYNWVFYDNSYCVTRRPHFCIFIVVSNNFSSPILCLRLCVYCDDRITCMFCMGADFTAGVSGTLYTKERWDKIQWDFVIKKTILDCLSKISVLSYLFRKVY
ncbi:hypothetical protein V8G54_002039 [Vigna mungo]|uniref:Uncharacterized protein n=1 Tax=Vigna mungo TaxID=3915 RepID=A0AAQ3P9E1_VIGMU